MKFFPYEYFKIKSHLSKSEAINRLKNVIEPKHYFRFLESNKKPYQGKIKGSNFEISRIIGYSNSFLPRIKGNIESEIDGCSICISMQPHILVVAYMIFWLGGVAFFFLAILKSYISSLGLILTKELTILLILVGMFIFGYAVLLGGFKFESENSKSFFQELFEAEEVEELEFVNPFRAAG